ncbi:MAG: condensation domain-containing protein, partial [Acidobacteriota bacterium]
MQDVQLLVVNPSGQLAGIGELGEVWVRSPHLALGYLRDETLSQQRFQRNPWSAEDGDRVYRTGDLGRYLPDGQLAFAGRADHQVKIRGFRVELGEVEAQLARLPGVREAVVLASPIGARRNPAERILVAYVVSHGAAELRLHEMRKLLARRLPEVMLPSAVVTLSALPLTPNGKVDRKALPEPQAVRPELETDFVGPRTPIERFLAELWTETLGIAAVGVHNDFFELGGNSISGVILINRLQEELGEVVQAVTIFDASTVAELADYLVERHPRAVARRFGEEEGAGAPDDERPETGTRIPRRVTDADPLPLSFSQQRLWFLDQWAPGSSAYNISSTVRLDGDLAVPRLAACVTEIVRRHEALRTTFQAVGGQPVQVIAEAVAQALPMVDLSRLTSHRQEAEARRLAAAESWRSFDLARGPLLRITLLRRTPQCHLAVMVMHHIVADGWSMGVLVREVAALYGALSRGEPSPLPELPIQYGDFALWQRQELRGERLDSLLAYWRRQLADAPAALELPADRPRPATQTFRGSTRPLTLSAELARDFHDFVRRRGGTSFMLLLALLDALLSRLTGQHDIVVGSPVANRNRRETEGLIGFFVNTLVLRVRLAAADPTFSEHLGRTREVIRQALAHQDLPFEKLVEKLEPERNPSHSPLFQVMLVLQNAPRSRIRLPGLTLSPVATGSPAAKFDMTFALAEDGEQLGGTVEFNSDLFDGTTAQRLARHFETMLAGVLVDPERRLSELPLLLAAERHQLLVSWNDSRVADGADLCLHQLIASRAAVSPEAVAVVFEDHSLSYRELDRRAGHLARHLAALGVEPDTAVGVCIERSLELVVGLLAVLKAGGAYLPLDPEYPPARLAFMLADAGSPDGRAPVLLMPRRLQAVLPQHGCRVVDPEDGVWQPQQEPRPAEPDHLAYVIYTSGSTGRPKGAMNSHRAIVNRLRWMQQAYRLGVDDRVLQKTPFSFDVSVWEFFWPLLTGARLVMARPGGHRDSAYLAHVIGERRITTLHFVPSMLQVFLAELRAASDRFTTRRPLRRVICSGEALPPELVERFFERLGGSLYNLYGPTEAAVDVTHWTCSPGGDRSTVPIGRPIS